MIRLTPKRPASAAQAGASKPERSGLTPKIRPDQSAASPVSVTPSWRMKSGRKGITKVKPLKETKTASIRTYKLRRQRAIASSSPTPAKGAILARLQARGNREAKQEGSVGCRVGVG